MWCCSPFFASSAVVGSALYLCFGFILHAGNFESKNGEAPTEVSRDLKISKKPSPRSLVSRPAALVGSRYGTHEVRCITRNIFDPENWDYEVRGEFLPAEEFKNYSLVIIAYAQERPFTLEEHALVEQYLREGGRVLLINQAPKALADSSSPSSSRAFYGWFGMELRRNRSLTPEDADVAADPILKNVVEADGERSARPSWISASLGVINLAGGAESLISNSDGALVARRRLGEGIVYYLGSEAFRLRVQHSPHVKDSGSYITLIRNIILEARTAK